MQVNPLLSPVKCYYVKGIDSEGQAANFVETEKTSLTSGAKHHS